MLPPRARQHHASNPPRQSRRRFLGRCLQGAGAAFATAGHARAAAAHQRNVLFICVDDLLPALGCYGDPRAKTPHMDRLARQGMLFDRAYCQQAVCSPSRVSFLTGLRPDTTRVYDLDASFRQNVPFAITLPQYFRARGYQSLSFGKIYHSGKNDPASWSEPAWVPRQSQYFTDESLAMREEFLRTFYGDEAAGALPVPAENAGEEAPETETTVGHVPRPPRDGVGEGEGEAETTASVEQPCAEDADAAPKRHWRNWQRRDLPPPSQLRDAYWGPSWEAPQVPESEHRDAMVAQAAIDALRGMGPRPFFMAVGFYKPHLPFVAPKAYFDLHADTHFRKAKNDYLPEGAPFFAAHDYEELRSYGDIPLEDDIEAGKQVELIRAYYACVSFIDAQIGRLLTALDETGLTDNTAVVLFGDHGWHFGEHAVWCKNTNWENAARVPLIIRTPDQPLRGARCSALVELVDLYPTLTDVCGAAAPSFLEGTSIAPLLGNPDLPWKTAAFTQYPRDIPDVEMLFRGFIDLDTQVMGRSVRTGRFRLTEWTDRRGTFTTHELYDYDREPNENFNLISLPAYQPVARELINLLHGGWRMALPPAVGA